MSSRETMTFAQIFELADMLINTQGILPPHVRTKGECVAIMLAGRELGFEPMASLRFVVLIKGKVTVDAAGQLALMIARGAQIHWPKDGRDGEAMLRIKRPGSPVHEEFFSLAMAKQAGLLSNAMWQKYPDKMLRARCVSAVGKAYYPDILAGVYAPGEMDDDPREEVPHELGGEAHFATHVLPAHASGTTRPMLSVGQTMPAPGGAPAPAQLPASTTAPQTRAEQLRGTVDGQGIRYEDREPDERVGDRTAPATAPTKPARTITDVLSDISKCEDLSKLDALLTEARAAYKTLPPALQHEVTIVCKAAPDAVKERDALRRERDEAERALAARSEAALTHPDDVAPEPGASDSELDPADAQPPHNQQPGAPVDDMTGVF